MPSDRESRLYLALAELVRLIAAAVAGYFGGTV